MTDEDIDEMMRVNVKSALYGMQEVLQHFGDRGTGHVINVSSIIADMIESRRPDVYTRQGSRQRVTDYYEAVGEDA